MMLLVFAMPHVSKIVSAMLFDIAAPRFILDPAYLVEWE